MDIPKVSIIMSVYNDSKEQLYTAIESIRNQTLKDWEFIICDDGTSKENAFLLREYCQKDKRIKVIMNKKNIGLTRSLNRCLKYAKANYVARMDADDISHKSRLEKQYNFLEKHKEYAFVGTKAYIFNDNGVYQVRNIEEKPSKRSFLKRSPFMHPTVMIRRQIYDEMNGYRFAKETRRAEDYDLFMRIYAKGYRGYNLQEELFYYREDKEAYRKRQYRYRIDEMIVRYKGFKKLGLLPKGYIYIIKPVFVGVLPRSIVQKLQKIEGIYK